MFMVGFFPIGVAMGVLFSDLLPVLRLWSLDGIDLLLLAACLVFAAIRAIGHVYFPRPEMTPASGAA